MSSSPPPKTADVGADALALGMGVLCAMSVVAPSRLVEGQLVAVLLGVLAVALMARRAPLRAADVLMGGWTIATAMSAWGWTVSPEASGVAWRTQLGVCTLFVLIRALSPRPRVLAGAAVGYLAGCLLAVVTIAQDHDLQFGLAFDTERTVLEDLDQNYLAYSMAAALVLLILLGARRRPPTRVALLCTALVLLVGANTAGTRGALVAVVGLAGWVVLSRTWPRRSFQGLLVVVVGLSVVSLTGWADSTVRENITANARERGDLNGRLSLWPYARGIFEEHPLFGIGAGAFRAANPLQLVAHSAPLEVAAGLGVLGLTLFYGAFYFTLVREARGWGRGVRELYAGGLLVVLTPILLTGHWHQAPAMWVAVAIASRADVVSGGRDRHLDVGDHQAETPSREVAGLRRHQ